MFVVDIRKKKSNTSPTKPNAPKSNKSKTPPRPPDTTTSSNKKPTSPLARHPALHRLITITATTIEDLDAHVTALEQAAIQAKCETRLLAGQQAQAFTAAALPLCRQV